MISPHLNLPQYGPEKVPKASFGNNYLLSVVNTHCSDGPPVVTGKGKLFTLCGRVEKCANCFERAACYLLSAKERTEVVKGKNFKAVENVQTSATRGMCRVCNFSIKSAMIPTYYI